MAEIAPCRTLHTGAASSDLSQHCPRRKVELRRSLETFKQTHCVNFALIRATFVKRAARLEYVKLETLQTNANCVRYSSKPGALLSFPQPYKYYTLLHDVYVRQSTRLRLSAIPFKKHLFTLDIFRQCCQRKGLARKKYYLFYMKSVQKLTLLVS